MPTLVATVGSATANSYVSLAEANTYFDERAAASAWTGADDVKNRALITATRRIDEESFKGETVTDGQALKWPRVGATNDEGEEYGSDVIPTCVKHATLEMALVIMNAGTEDALADTGLEAFKRARIGNLEVETRGDYEGGDLPAAVRRKLAPVIATTRSSGRTVLA